MTPGSWKAALLATRNLLRRAWQSCSGAWGVVSQYRRRWWRWGLVAVLVLVSYPLTATTLLWSGLLERLLESDDLRVEIEGPAWSILPGRLHLEALRVYVNEDTQVLVAVDNAELDVELVELAKKRFSVTSLVADEVRYRMRVRVPKAELQSERVQAFPNIDRLPGDASLVRKPDDGSEGGGLRWTIQIRGIDVAVSELWFFEYRYVGSGRVRGGFLLSPSRLGVDQSAQDLGPGELRFGEKRVLLKDLRGTVSAEIPEYDRGQQGGIGVLRAMNAKVKLDADVQSVAPLSAYLDDWKLAEGRGPLKIRASMQGGALKGDSKLSYRSEEVRASGDSFELKSDAELTLDLAPRQKESKSAADKDAKAETKQAETRPLRLRSQAKSSYLSFAKVGKQPFTLQAHDHEHMMLFNSGRIDGLDSMESATLKFPNLQTTDLDDLAAWSDAIEVTQQEGKVRANLELELRKHGEWGGPLNLDFDQVSLRFAKARAKVRGEAKCWLQFNPKQKVLSLGDLSLSLKVVGFHVGDWETIDDWWLQLSAKRLSLLGIPPHGVESDLSIKAKDAEPLLQLLAAKSELPDAVAMLTSLSDLRVRAELHKDAQTLDLMVDALESSVIDVSGRLYETKGDRRLALVVGGDTVSLGIHQYRGETDFEVQAGAPWLNRQLKKFPGPTKRVGSPRP